MATAVPLEIKTFSNGAYKFKNPAGENTGKTSLTSGSNHIVDVVMWPEFGNSSFYMGEARFFKDLARKTKFYEGWSMSTFNNLGLVLDIALKFRIVWQKWQD